MTKTYFLLEYITEPVLLLLPVYQSICPCLPASHGDVGRSSSRRQTRLLIFEELHALTPVLSRVHRRAAYSNVFQMASALLQRPTLGLRPILKEKKAEKQKSIPRGARKTKPNHMSRQLHMFTLNFPRRQRPRERRERSRGSLRM